MTTDKSPETIWFGMLEVEVPLFPSPRRPLHERCASNIIEAKAVYESGNELGALDAFYLCADMERMPEWITNAMPLDAITARHRKYATGRHSRALLYTRDHRRMWEHYQVVLVARRHDRVRWIEAYERAEEILSYTSKFADTHAIERNYKKVSRELKRGLALNYWYPVSPELREHLEAPDDLGVVTYVPGE